MATFTVTTASDIVNAGDGVLSLREAVALANNTTASDMIVFAPAIEGRTLTLTGGELTLTQDTTIDGDQNNNGVGVTLSGGGINRIVQITGVGTDAIFRDLMFLDGRTLFEYQGSGGAIYSSGRSLKIFNSDFINNTSFSDDSFGYGGAVCANGGSLEISDSLFLGNHSRVGGAVSGTNGASVTIARSELTDNRSVVGGAIGIRDGHLMLEDSMIANNYARYYHSGGGGGISVDQGSAVIARCSIVGNVTKTDSGGGVSFSGSTLTISDSTIANNSTGYYYGITGGGIAVSYGNLILRNSTITGNSANGSAYYESDGGGIALSPNGQTSLDIANTIVAGNIVRGAGGANPDISASITLSNGHNMFGSDVLGNVAGDVENVAASAIFAAVDPTTGGGLVNAAGIAPLRANVANPALGGADRFAISSTDQIGTARPTPAGTNPDIGAAESGFAHSKVASANNDTLTGTAAANTLNGLAGHDFLKGRGGADTLNGGDGGDFLEGGVGNDKINGNAGIDIANYGDSATAVTVDLRGDTAADKDTAKRGTETDTLTGIEGAITAGGNDRLYGDNGNNWFQGGGGKDTFTGGAGRDLYDYNLTSASPVGSGRDVITDFVHLQDDIDLMGIDANTTVAGNQAFRWVGTAALTGPGEVGYFTSGGNTIIRMSTDADVASEGEIQLTGIKTLSALDFYL